MVADDAPPNETETATINFDECQQKPAPPPSLQQQQQLQQSANDEPQQANIILTSNAIAENLAKTTKMSVIQTQPASPINQLPNAQLATADKLIIEQTVPINMKKTTSDIWYKFKHFIHRMCFCNTVHSLKT